VVQGLQAGEDAGGWRERMRPLEFAKVPGQGAEKRSFRNEVLRRESNQKVDSKLRKEKKERAGHDDWTKTYLTGPVNKKRKRRTILAV